MTFDAFRQKMIAEDLPAAAIDTFEHYYEQLRRGETGLLSEERIEAIDGLPDSENLSGYEAPGRQAIAKAVVIKLNGGLGTGMGMTSAKSLLPVKDGLSFLDITAKQILHLRETHSCPLPLVLMNSFRTRGDSIQALSRHKDLACEVPADFLQHKVPKIRADDMTPVEWPDDPEHEWCPPGHGDIYTALVTSGILARLLEDGYEYAFVSNSDNLGAVLSLEILGWFADEKVPFLMEVADRTEADKKGGHLARQKGGGLILREVAQCPPGEIGAFRDVTRYKYFNTNTLWVNLRSLADTLEARNNVLGLPMIRNKKTVDPKKPESPDVFQLETAMGAAISVFDGARAIRVPRERFVPVKTTNDLLVLWSDVYKVTEDFRVVTDPSHGVGDLVVDLDPQHFKLIDQLQERFPHGAPSLAQCKRLEVRGDFRFGKDVTVRGTVRLENSDAQARLVPDGEVFD